MSPLSVWRNRDAFACAAALPVELLAELLRRADQRINQ